MDIFELYATPEKHNELQAILTYAAQNHKDQLPASFIEKDIWVTELLRLLYDENLLNDQVVAFKGGTALSKCWKTISRFSEDIDLSIHWTTLLDNETDEVEMWSKTTKSNSQNKKFRNSQTKRLEEWSSDFTDKLNTRLEAYGIENLAAEQVDGSKGEKIQVKYPRLAESEGNSYLLDYVLLEFGARNRGKPTKNIKVTTYLSEAIETGSLKLPTAQVEAFAPEYILWEKLTALHQFCTQTKKVETHRLARHWYDTDRLIQDQVVSHLESKEAMYDVIEMKKQRWSQAGVDYESIISGQLQIIPEHGFLSQITEDHNASITGGMFFDTPDSMDVIMARLKKVQAEINKSLLS